MSEVVTLAELLAENRRLREALEPFARCRFVKTRPPESLVMSTLAGALYIADFHRAREAYDATA